MDKSALVETLVMSKKTHSIVQIKIARESRPVVGAVQKVLNQIIILKPAAAEPITLTFADIESVSGTTDPFWMNVWRRVVVRCRRIFSPLNG